MRFINYLLLAVLLVGCGSVFGQDGTKVIPEKVRDWTRQAEQGNADAQFNLGFMYEYGKGVPQDYQQAAKWYKLAANQGHAYGQYNLGLMYVQGDGVPQDYQNKL